MLHRKILIIDDNPRIENVYIPAYNRQINQIKDNFPKWKEYEFLLTHKGSMHDALNYLSDPENVVDVLVVDYDFGGERTFTNGTAFVRHIREKVNRHCQIVFYTMQAMDSVEKSELRDLINSDVYKFIDKSSDTSAMAKVIFDAATQRNPVVESLEKFMVNYKNLLKTYEYSFEGTKITFSEMINHIRMDDEIGRTFIEKLLQKGILLSTDIGR